MCVCAWVFFVTSYQGWSAVASNSPMGVGLCVCACVSVYVCPPVCAHAALLLRLLNYETFPCCCHGPGCFWKYELLFLSQAEHPIWGGLANNSSVVFKRKHKVLKYTNFHVIRLGFDRFGSAFYFLLQQWKGQRWFMELKRVCIFCMPVCRRTTTCRSAWKWCSKSSWSSTVRGKRK